MLHTDRSKYTIKSSLLQLFIFLFIFFLFRASFQVKSIEKSNRNEIEVN